MVQGSQAGQNVLIEVAPFDETAEEALYHRLSQSPPTDTNLLVMSYRQDPDTWLSEWQVHVNEVPADLGYIHVGETTRSAASASAGNPPARTHGFVEALSDPADLTGLGILVSQYLKEWANTENQIVIYLDSLTALLQFVDLNTAYRFLHVLTGRVKSVGGRTYYRVDPDAHETQTIATIQSLMDDTIALQQQ